MLVSVMHQRHSAVTSMPPLPCRLQHHLDGWPTSRPLAKSGCNDWRGVGVRERKPRCRFVVHTVCGPLTPLM